MLDDLGGDVQWLHSYVTDDKLFCVYIAPNEQRVREQAPEGRGVVKRRTALARS